MKVYKKINGLLVPVGGGAYNTEELITVSGSWTVPFTTDYEVTVIGGGGAPIGGCDAAKKNAFLWNGTSGGYLTRLVHLSKGSIIPVTIGAATPIGTSQNGGITSFGGIASNSPGYIQYGRMQIATSAPTWGVTVCGPGIGGNDAGAISPYNYGCGGASQIPATNGASTLSDVIKKVGMQGAVKIRYNNPNK